MTSSVFLLQSQLDLTMVLNNSRLKLSLCSSIILLVAVLLARPLTFSNDTAIEIATRRCTNGLPAGDGVALSEASPSLVVFHFRPVLYCISSFCSFAFWVLHNWWLFDCLGHGRLLSCFLKLTADGFVVSQLTASRLASAPELASAFRPFTPVSGILGIWIFNFWNTVVSDFDL